MTKQAAYDKAKKMAQLTGEAAFIVYDPVDDFDTSPERPYTVMDGDTFEWEGYRECDLIDIVEP